MGKRDIFAPDRGPWGAVVMLVVLGGLSAAAVVYIALHFQLITLFIAQITAKVLVSGAPVLLLLLLVLLATARLRRWFWFR